MLEKICKAELSDLQDIAALESEIFSDAWSLKSLEETWNQKNAVIFAAKTEEKIGGIIIPDTCSKEKPTQGTVIAVGNGTKDEPMILKQGDSVLYGKYAGQEIELDGEKYLIMRQADVLAVVE